MKRSYLALSATMLWLTCLSAHALTKQEALLRLGEVVLKPSENDEQICAWMTPAPLASGIITTLDGDVTVDIASLGGDPHWFAYVDLEPCALLEHDVQYVFIRDTALAQDATVTVVDADNWPALDGDEIEDGPAIGGNRILIYPAIPRPSPTVTAAEPQVPNVDFGGAPDGQEAYPGVTGMFPTLFNSPNAFPGRNGANAGAFQPVVP